MKKGMFSCVIISMIATSSFSQDYSKNIFEDHADIGACAVKGDVTFDPAEQSFNISGSGDNIWFNNDQFHYAWTKIDGDFILRAHLQFAGEGTNAHRKAGWMIRSTLDTCSSHVSATVHGDGLTSLQYRRMRGEETAEKRSKIISPDVIQLERKGDTFILSCAVYGNPFDTVMITDDFMTGEVYAGLFVCSHDNSETEKVRFSNVRIIRPAKEGFIPYRDYIGSNLEILDVETGLRKVIFQIPRSIQAPNWTPDGKYLIYNSNGMLYRFDLITGDQEVINSGFATANNNDHVLSFDGKMIGISHHVAQEGNNSVIYTIPAEGGTPERITPEGPSYLHGWSPDGKYLVYTGGRNNNYDIYRISVSGKTEERLTESAELDDGSEYSPDGSYIYFNSARSGKMQIWRMRDDGSQQEQVTFDDYNNWFPHISPDGKWIVFLSFLPEVRPDDHPFYKHVYIRLMPFKGGESRIVAYLYGGQGTINVPSWSPDSKKIAFVSNTDIIPTR